MATSNGQIALITALSGDEVKLVITGELKGRLQRVDVLIPRGRRSGATSWHAVRRHVQQGVRFL
ncbi:DUF1131 domain-containing protein [Serratia ureilytica]